MTPSGIEAVSLLAGPFPVSRMPAPALAVDSSHLDLYPSYDEVTDEMFLIAGEHPNIVTVVPIGVTFEGRDIWAVEVPDNVDDDGDRRINEDNMDNMDSDSDGLINGLQDRLRGR